MKVLLINSVCGVGSTGRICTDLAAALEAQGNEAKIAYGRNAAVPPQFQRYAVRIGSQADVLSHVVLSRLTDSQGFHSAAATKRFLRWIAAYDPDVIHLHNLHGYYLNIGQLFGFLKEWRKPVVWTLHDCWAFTGHCACFDYAECGRWQTGCGSCPQKHAYPGSLLLDRSAQHYQIKKSLFSGVPHMTLVTPSHWLKGLVKQTFLAAHPTEVIANGIDTGVFQPTQSTLREQYGLTDKKIVLGVSMGWPPSKHLDYMLRLADDLGDGYRVVLIGLDRTQLKRLPPAVLGFAATDSVRELAGWYSAADVCVNPTMEDNYPTVNLEAQACGTPVVTFMTGGSPECIKKHYGAAVTRGSYEALLKAVRETASLKGTVPVPHITGREEFADAYLALYRRLTRDFCERQG